MTSPHPQRPLPLLLSAATPLVDVGTARAALGCDADSVHALLDAGALRWTWDVAAGDARERRELRIWTECLTAYQHSAPQPGDTLNEVLRRLLGGRARFRTGEVAQLLCVDRSHLLRLVNAGELARQRTGHGWWVPAPSLGDFLRRRSAGPKSEVGMRKSEGMKA